MKFFDTGYFKNSVPRSGLAKKRTINDINMNTKWTKKGQRTNKKKRKGTKKEQKRPKK